MGPAQGQTHINWFNGLSGSCRLTHRTVCSGRTPSVASYQDCMAKGLDTFHSRLNLIPSRSDSICQEFESNGPWNGSEMVRELWFIGQGWTSINSGLRGTTTNFPKLHMDERTGSRKWETRLDPDSDFYRHGLYDYRRRPWQRLRMLLNSTSRCTRTRRIG